MKKILRIFLIIFIFNNTFGQIKTEDRFKNINHQLTEISKSNNGYLQKVNFNVQDTKLTDFVRAIANMYKVDISIDNELSNIKLQSNFSNATVKDILIYLCKEHDLTIHFTGEIISLKKHIAPKKEYTKEPLMIGYDQQNEIISFELKKDTLFQVFKKISELTEKNLVFAPGMENITLTSYINKLPLDSALKKLAFTNNLSINKTKNGHYIFENKESVDPGTNNSKYSNNNNRKERPARRFKDSNFYYRVIDTLDKTIEVDFENTSIESIIKQISQDLQINTFTTSPLNNIGTATVTASRLNFDALLDNILHNTNYSYKKENNFYFFGEKKQEQIQKSLILPLQYRSIKIFNVGQSSQSGNSSKYFNQPNSKYNNNSSTSQLNNNSSSLNSLNSNYNSNKYSTNSTNNISNTFNKNSTNNGSSIENLIPSEYTKNIDRLKIDERVK